MFTEKFKRLYSNTIVDEENVVVDEKYRQLIETMTRVKQQLGGQQMALNSLVMKVNNLIERKTKREAIRAGKDESNKNFHRSSRSQLTDSRFAGRNSKK